jgi:hypothetical protein
VLQRVAGERDVAGLRLAVHQPRPIPRAAQLSSQVESTRSRERLGFGPV